MCSQLFCQIARQSFGSLPLLFLMAACAQPRSTLVELALRIEPAGRPGVYRATGTTNLPEGSQITVTSVRDLHPKNFTAQLNTPKTNYAILARQTAEVAQGKWQTTLNLWQASPDGRYQETWQLNQSDFGTSLQPGDKVAFLAMFEPDRQVPSIRQQLEQKNMEINGPLLRFAADGQRYLQVSQTLAVDLPTGKTTPPVVTTADMNGGWGDRSALPPDKPVTEKLNLSAPQGAQTTAPLSAAEFLR